VGRIKAHYATLKLRWTDELAPEYGRILAAADRDVAARALDRLLMQDEPITFAGLAKAIAAESEPAYVPDTGEAVSSSDAFRLMWQGFLRVCRERQAEPTEVQQNRYAKVLTMLSDGRRRPSLTLVNAFIWVLASDYKVSDAEIDPFA